MRFALFLGGEEEKRWQGVGEAVMYDDHWHGSHFRVLQVASLNCQLIVGWIIFLKHV